MSVCALLCLVFCSLICLLKKIQIKWSKSDSIWLKINKITYEYYLHLISETLCTMDITNVIYVVLRTIQKAPYSHHFCTKTMILSSDSSLPICQSNCLPICLSSSNMHLSIQSLVTNDKHNGFIEKQKARDRYFLRRRTMGTLLHSPSPFHPWRSTREPIVGTQCNMWKLLRRHITFN